MIKYVCLPTLVVANFYIRSKSSVMFKMFFTLVTPANYHNTCVSHTYVVFTFFCMNENNFHQRFSSEYFTYIVYYAVGCCVYYIC